MDTVLIKEKHGISIWCAATGCIKLCFSNLVFCMTIPELNDFIKELYNACPVEKSNAEGNEVAAYVLPTPIPTLQLVFTAKEQLYLLDFCKQSIQLAQTLVLAN